MSEQFKSFKFHSEVKQEQTEERECLLSIGVESFVFQFVLQTYEDQNTHTLILPVVFDGCETWSLTLKEERTLWVFQNRVLRRMFGPKKFEVKGEWTNL